MNKVILVGRLVRDPELKTTPSGVSVCSFTVACDRRYQKEGEDRQADFINCVAWRGTADFVSKYITKGTRIALDGSIQTRSWDDDQGNRRYVTEVLAEHVEFAQSKSEGQSKANDLPQMINQPTSNNDGYISEGFMPVVDEDLPFF